MKDFGFQQGSFQQSLLDQDEVSTGVMPSESCLCGGREMAMLMFLSLNPTAAGCFGPDSSTGISLYP